MVPLQAYQYTWGSASRYKGIDISTMSCHLHKQISESVRLESLNVEVSGEKFRFMQWSTSLQNLDSHLMRTLVSVLAASLPSAQCPDSWKHKHRDHHWPSDQTVMSSSPISLDPAKLYLAVVSGSIFSLPTLPSTRSEWNEKYQSRAERVLRWKCLIVSMD